MNIALPYFYYIFGFALGVLLLVIIFIPKHEIQKLFWLSAIWGSGSNFIIEYIFVLAGLTRYEHITPFNIGFLPIWIVLDYKCWPNLFLDVLPQTISR